MFAIQSIFFKKWFKIDHFQIVDVSNEEIKNLEAAK